MIRPLHQIRMVVRVHSEIIRLGQRVGNRQVFLGLVMPMTHAIKLAAVQESQNVMHNFPVPLLQFAHRLVVTARILVTIGQILMLVQSYFGAKPLGKMTKLVRVRVVYAIKDILFPKPLGIRLTVTTKIIGTMEMEVLLCET